MVTDDNRETNLVAVKANSVEIPYGRLILHAKQYRKEKLVIDSYYNQLKNVCQIAQEARISFRDISAVIKKQ